METNRLFDNEFENMWCPGCGNFPILSAMKQAFTDLGLTPADLLIVSGIGQAGKTPHFFNCNMFHVLHGRTLPVATGAKIANKNLNIVVNSGDGDCYGEGGNHFLAAIRRNIDLTLLVHNNMVYGLTKGQISPTTSMGMATSTQPDGTMSSPINPLALAINQGAGFVARGFAGEKEKLTQLIKSAMEFKGFSLVDVFQPCVTFNHLNTFQWFKERVYDLGETDHDPTDKKAALDLSCEWGDKMPIGILYKEEKPNFHDRVTHLKDGPLISHDFDPRAVAAAIF